MTSALMAVAQFVVKALILLSAGVLLVIGAAFCMAVVWLGLQKRYVRYVPDKTPSREER